MSKYTQILLKYNFFFFISIANIFIERERSDKYGKKCQAKHIKLKKYAKLKTVTKMYGKNIYT